MYYKYFLGEKVRLIGRADNRIGNGNSIVIDEDAIGTIANTAVKGLQGERAAYHVDFELLPGIAIRLFLDESSLKLVINNDK